MANTNIELANIEEKYQKASLLYNQSPTGLILVKADGIIKESNSIANNIAGLPENETLVGKNVTDFVTSDEEKQKFYQLLKERKETNVKQNIINYRGEITPILLQSSYISEKDEFLTFISDISSVIKVEQKAQELEQRYRNIVQLSPDGIILIDENCNILELSQAATKILNINNTTPKNLFNIINIYDQKRLKELIATISSGNDIATTEFIIENQANNTTNVCEVSMKAIKSLNDTTLTYILTIRDITKRKLLVNNLIRSERMAGIGKLTTTIAHEINQPLLAMTFTLDNILDNIRNNKINIEYLNKKAVRIYEDIDRITHIIDQIRSYSHSNNQSTTTTFNPNISIENAANLLTSQLQSENITIYYNLDNHLPKANGNSFQFDQVIINMLTNAQEAISRRQMKEKNDYTGKITITSESNEKEIIISINDNGIGIEKDKINHLLQPFYTIKTDGSSAGIGLGICLEIIEKMNGKLEIESTLNIGTTFRIILPIK